MDFSIATKDPEVDAEANQDDNEVVDDSDR